MRTESIALVEPFLWRIIWRSLQIEKDPASSSLCRVSNISEQLHGFVIRIRASRLKCIPQAELELSIGGIGRAFTRHFPKCAAGRVHVRIVPVGVVEEVEGLCSEDQFMVLMARDDVEALLERSAEAAETRAIHDVAGAARSKRANSRGLKDTRVKPHCAIGGAELVRKQR